MQRISVGLALLTGLAALVSGCLIRAELAFAGLAIFAPEDAAYAHVRHLHGAAGYGFAAASIALGAFVAAPAWGPARLIGWPALLVALAGLALAGYAGALALGVPAAAQAALPGMDLFAAITPPRTLGTAFFDPTGANAPRAQFHPLHIPFALLAGMHLAVLALIAARTGLRRAALAGAVLVLLCAAGIAAQLATGMPGLVLLLVILATLAVLAPLAIELADSDGPAAPFLLTGLLLTLVFAIVLSAILPGWPRPWSVGAPMSDIATIHVVSLMAPFLLCAGLHARRAVPLSGPALWTSALALGVGSVLAYGPYARLALQGMPAGHADYPAAFAALNLDASFGGLLLSGVIVALTIALLRRPRTAAGPARQAGHRGRAARLRPR